jgi:cobalt-zinc-cadmium efflux system membrane fusion protein
MYEQAEDTEKDAKADLTAAEEQLKVLGVDKDHPSPVVNVYAPVSGVIIAQNVTRPAPRRQSFRLIDAFTIADLSTSGFSAMSTRTISQGAARPDGADSHQRLSRQGAHRPHQRHRPCARPQHSHRQGPHRGANPGILKLGMFVTATFESKTKQTTPVSRQRGAASA